MFKTRRFIKEEGKNLWDYTYIGENCCCKFEKDRFNTYEYEDGAKVYKIELDRYIYTLRIKETKMCYFYNLKKEIKGIESMFVYELEDKKMSLKDFYGKALTKFRVYESDEELFFVFGEYDGDMNIKWYMPVKKDGSNMVYKEIPNEVLGKYTMNCETNVVGLLSDLSNNDDVFVNTGRVALKTTDNDIVIDKKDVLKWAEKKEDYKTIYVTTRRNEQYVFRSYTTEFFDFVTYAKHELTEEQLEGFVFKINKRLRKERKDGIVKSLEKEEVFGWLCY